MNRSQIRDFRRSFRRLERALDVLLKDCCCEVTIAQCHVLMEVERLEKPTIGDLAADLGLDKSTLSRSIDNLVLLRLVKRLSDPSDRRAQRIALTGAGRKVCNRINRQSDRYFRDVFSRVPRRLHEGLLEHFQLLVDAVAPPRGARPTGPAKPAPACKGPVARRR